MLAVATLILCACVQSYAQQASSANSQIIKACEAAVDEVQVRRVEVDGLKEQLRLVKEQSALKDQLIATLQASADFWKTAATERKDALSIDNRIEVIRMQQIVEYKDEVNSLRAENARLRRSRTRWFLFGVIGGTLVPKIP